MLNPFANTLLGSSVLVAIALSTSSPASTPPTPRGVEALDWAFTFASAIEADPTDKGRAQEGTVMDYPKLGALDLAVERAATVEGWRRGVVYADLAIELSREGRTEQARELLRKAEQVRAETSGWQGPRIEAHVAQALVFLGEEQQARQIAERLAEADARQYQGRSVATMASAVNAREGFDAAMQLLGALDSSEDLDTVWWRTMGYLELARNVHLDDGQRRRALASTKDSAADIAGWKRAEVLAWLSLEWRARDSARARALLEEAEGLVLASPETSAARGPLLAEIAAGWAALGDRKRAAERFEQALAAAPHAMAIDQPEIYARIATAYVTAEDLARAREMFDRALTLAGDLVNSRPRALALTSILRSMGQARMELDESTRARLVALKSGLGDPW